MPLCRSVLVLSPIGSISLSCNAIKWNIIDKMLGLFQTPLVVPSPFDRRQECEDWLGVAFALGLLSPAALLLHPSVEHRLLEAPAIAQPESWNLPLPNVFIECVRSHA